MQDPGPYAGFVDVWILLDLVLACGNRVQKEQPQLYQQHEKEQTEQEAEEEQELHGGVAVVSN